MRYICCGCQFRNAHRVLGYELVEEDCEPFVRITISTPEVSNRAFLCLAFRSIPTGLTSYPIKVLINDTDVDIVNRSGRTITTSDLHECILLSGIYSDDRCPIYTIC